MHNKVKRIAAVLLSVVMALSVFGGMGFTASAASSGTCGAKQHNNNGARRKTSLRFFPQTACYARINVLN